MKYWIYVFFKDISHNNIREIHEDAFDELSYAFHFDASYNLLSSFGQVPMKFQKGIKMLNVSFNQIQEKKSRMSYISLIDRVGNRDFRNISERFIFVANFEVKNTPNVYLWE